MNFLEVLKQEFKTIFGDVAIVLTIIGGVLLYSFMYPQPYLNETLSKIPISVVDMDKTKTSRDLIFMLKSSSDVDVVRVDNSYNDAKKAFLLGQVKGIITIPINFEKDLYLEKRPTITIGADGSYFLLYGGVVEAGMKTVLAKIYSLKIANLLKNNTPTCKAKTSYTAYSLKSINIYNPDNSYLQYVIPAVFVLILQQTMLIGLGIVGGGVNEKIYKNYNYNSKTLHVILARLLIFGGLFFVHSLYYFGVCFEYLHIYHLASFKDMLMFIFLFLTASASFGIFFGSLLKSREMATPLVLFSSLPLVFSSGFVWPRDAMDKWIVLVSDFFPSTVAIDGFLKLNQLGSDFSMILQNSTILFLQSIVYLFLAYFIISKKRKNLQQ